MVNRNETFGYVVMTLNKRSQKVRAIYDFARKKLLFDTFVCLKFYFTSQTKHTDFLLVHSFTRKVRRDNK